MPKVSIIVPVYNSAKYIIRCVDSIREQTFKDLEILLINDGSKDDSLDKLKRFQSEDSRIRVIDKDNEGVSATRNRGVDEARGEYIQFVDSDDFIEKNMIENTLIELEEKEADLILTGLYLDIQNGDKISSSIQTFDDEVSIGANNISKSVLHRLNGTYINSPINKLYKKSIIINNNIKMDHDISLGEDLIFNIQYLKYCNKVIFKEASYYHYCMQANDNLTFQYRENKLELMKILYDNCLGYFKECELSNDEVIELNNIFIKWMYSCFIDLFNKNCNLSFKQKKIFINNAIMKYNNIIKKTSNNINIYLILKYILRLPILVLLVSKVIYIIKTSFRKILYR